MPAPFSPNPADHSSVRQPAADKAPSTQTGPDANVPDAEAITPLIGPRNGDAIPEAPTVISANRPRMAVDPRIGEALAGRRLGHFELIEAVGAGGMAAVLKARDLDLGRVVALKILPPDMAADPENIVRFKQEARAAAKLDHDNIARVYFFGEDQGLHFIAFEFVEGDNLRQLMDANGGTIPVRDAVALMLQVTAGLAHAAERNVVHRDIKPSNIIVTPDGRAKIVDMGLARSLDHRGVGQLTETGVTLGTFDYISPEQAIEPRLADVRSDIYSLGCTFYHALTGFSPVPDGNAAKKLDAQKYVLPPDPRMYNASIPADLAAVLGRMMAKDPDSRYQNPEHLASHLRAVARKLGIPTGPLPAHGKAFEDPLPAPPRMSAAWVLTAVTVMALAIGIFTNAFNHPPPGPPAPDDRVAGLPDVDPGIGGPMVVGRRDAANVDELLALLKQGVKNIRLTGGVYDLFSYRGEDGQPVAAALLGDDVRLEGTPGLNAPTLRLGNAPDGKARSKTLTLRGPANGKGTAYIRGVRFWLPALDSDDEDTGLLVTGFDRVTVEDCSFTTGYRPNRDGPSAIAVVLRDGSADFTRCYFAPGCVGVAVDGPGRVSLTECAIAPHYAGVRVVHSAADATGETELTFSHCSALTPANGTIVELGDLTPCIVRAGHCLFAGPERFGLEDMPVVLRQHKSRAATTRYEAEANRPNAYYNIAAFSEGEETYTFAQAAQEKLPIADVERPLKHPWEDRDPFALLAAKPPNPLRAFKQNMRLPELRVAEDPTRSMLGTQFLGPERLYPSPFQSTDSEPRDATVKVWDPSLSETADDLPPGVFATLAKALASVRSGDTLLIRHTGRLEVDPSEFTRKDTNLIIKPDAGHKPVLVPAPAVLKRAAGLFKLYGGRLVLDGLHFRLQADRAPSIAVVPGGAHLEIRNAVISMEDGEDLSAVTLTDPRGEMMMGGTKPEGWPVPKLTLENVFIRGKGRLLAVKGSRPFELSVKNALAALDDTMIDIEPSSADPSSAGSGIVQLTRVTAYLSGSLLHVRASDRKSEMGPTGLTRTEISATGCVFAPAATAQEPFVRADRIDTHEQAERLVSWRGRNNVYGYDKKKIMLELRPTDIEVMPIKPIDGDRWLAMTFEEGDPFASVFFEYKLPDSGQTRRFLGVKPIDFDKVRFDPSRPDGVEFGAPADVPAPFPDE
jgi:serine/threonine protein kinase